MKNLKQIESVLSPPTFHWVGDGFRVHNFFPGGYHQYAKHINPFYLIDYNSKYEFAPTENRRGVGVHPHRGFETVTFAYHGAVAHHDSYGNSGVIYEGDVQWMTAGSGVLHKEYHEQNYALKGGPFQMVQIWVNLPSKFKMTKPKYQAITRKNMGKYELPDGRGVVSVVAGNYKEVKGPASTFTHINLFDISLVGGSDIEFQLPEHHNSGILVIKGSAEINDHQKVQTDYFVLFKNKGTDIAIKAAEESVFLVLSGEPINEPVAQYGPFLMNTHREIEQAIEDFNSGKFGYLED